MSTLLIEIEQYFLSIGYELEKIYEEEKTPARLATLIMTYAHRNQQRENGNNYSEHPLTVSKRYIDLMKIHVDETPNIDVELLNSLEIPVFGVIEVALLHDVVEDANINFYDLKDVFDECGFGDYYNNYIKIPLDFITHEKGQPYADYIRICMANPTSALVKMLDLQDNSNLLTLSSLKSYKLNRTINYLKYIKMINDRYYFIEKFDAYRKQKRIELENNKN